MGRILVIAVLIIYGQCQFQFVPLPDEGMPRLPLFNKQLAGYEAALERQTRQNRWTVQQKSTSFLFQKGDEILQKVWFKEQPFLIAKYVCYNETTWIANYLSVIDIRATGIDAKENVVYATTEYHGFTTKLNDIARSINEFKPRNPEMHRLFDGCLTCLTQYLDLRFPTDAIVQHRIRLFDITRTKADVTSIMTTDTPIGMEERPTLNKRMAELMREQMYEESQIDWNAIPIADETLSYHQKQEAVAPKNQPPEGIEGNHVIYVYIYCVLF